MAAWLGLGGGELVDFMIVFLTLSSFNDLVGGPVFDFLMYLLFLRRRSPPGCGSFELVMLGSPTGPAFRRPLPRRPLP
jgi:hypothetical protein